MFTLTILTRKLFPTSNILHGHFSLFQLTHGQNLLRSYNSSINAKRNILSSAYACSDTWNSQRKECETLKSIAPERYFFELNQKYQQKKPVSPIDIDVYINSLHKLENQEELEHMIRRFRSTKQCVETLDSTHHAVFRFYFLNGKVDRLLEILNNRLEFGIFPDVYCYNILLDYSLKAGRIDNAFDTVKLLMLQEYSGNNITKALSFHALQKSFEDGLFGLIKKEEMKSSTEQTGEKDEEASAAAEEDDDEIEYIRVPYITNPYFDDHFDLIDKVKLWGKSMYFFGHELSLSVLGNDYKILSNNAKILGLIAYEKFDKLEKILECLGTSVEIVPETLELVELKLRALEEAPEGDAKAEGDKILTQDTEKVRKCLNNIKNLKQAPSQTTFKSQSDQLLKEIPKWESQDIDEQLKNFKEFEKIRIDKIKLQIERILHEQRRQEIDEKTKEIEEKKRLYYFFENFAKHEIDFVNAEKRIKEIRAKTVVDEDYMPPEI